jgi:hypothetical protein
VAELVDALVSGTSGAIRGGSSPLLGTNFNRLRNIRNVFSGIDIGKSAKEKRGLDAFSWLATLS